MLLAVGASLLGVGCGAALGGDHEAVEGTGSGTEGTTTAVDETGGSVGPGGSDATDATGTDESGGPSTADDGESGSDDGGTEPGDLPDPPVPPDCALDQARCVGPGEEYDTEAVASQPELAFQAAIDEAMPGDAIYIRGGTYVHDAQQTQSDQFLDVHVSGEPGAPISIRSFPGEWAIIEGWGHEPGQTQAPGPDNELVFVTGDHIVVSHLELRQSAAQGLKIHGSDGHFHHLVVHHSWLNNIELSHADVEVRDNLIEHNVVYQSQHYYGIAIMRSDGNSNDTFTSDNVIQFNLSFRNGYYGEPGAYTQVPTVTGDNPGGGNSDGFFAYKNCHDTATADNQCPDNHFRFNIAWSNADDGYDTTFGDGSSLVGNLSFLNGPEGNRGFKVLRYVVGTLSFVGNVAMTNDQVGFETRADQDVVFVHNLAVGNPQQGAHVLSNGFSPAARIQNNVVADGLNSSPGATSSHNTTSAPSAFVPDTSCAPVSIVDGVPQVEACWQAIHDQFRDAFAPSPGDPRVDAGVVIEGLHCGTADDSSDPPDPKDPSCRHWAGTAPDQGPFELGL